MGLPAPSTKARALKLLARREHSRAELERKLLAEAEAEGEGDGATLQAVRALLDDLEARGLQSDTRVAESVVSARASRLGPRRLQQQLKAKGLAADIVDQALAPVRDGEFAQAREVWTRRFGTPAADPRERARQARFLAGRGFSADVIRRVVQGLEGD